MTSDTSHPREGCETESHDPRPALELRGLTKSFGAKRAVDGLDSDAGGLDVGLVGPNGAGKTTTLSMATGLLRPDAGTAYVLGHDVWSDRPQPRR